jgi:hypothetical protein
MTDSGPWSVGGGPAGASPENASALDDRRERGNGPPEEDRKPRPGCLRTLIAIILVLLGLAVAWYLIGLAIGQLA